MNSDAPARPAMVTDAMIDAAHKADDRSWGICDNGLAAIYLAMHQAAMNGDVVERVARAICGYHVDGPSDFMATYIDGNWENHTGEARAAIASLMGSRI